MSQKAFAGRSLRVLLVALLGVGAVAANGGAQFFRSLVKGTQLRYVCVLPPGRPSARAEARAARRYNLYDDAPRDVRFLTTRLLRKLPKRRLWQRARTDAGAVEAQLHEQEMVYRTVGATAGDSVKHGTFRVGPDDDFQPFPAAYLPDTLRDGSPESQQKLTVFRASYGRHIRSSEDYRDMLKECIEALKQAFDSDIQIFEEHDKKSEQMSKLEKEAKRVQKEIDSKKALKKLQRNVSTYDAEIVELENSVGFIYEEISLLNDSVQYLASQVFKLRTKYGLSDQRREQRQGPNLDLD